MSGIAFPFGPVRSRHTPRRPSIVTAFANARFSGPARREIKNPPCQRVQEGSQKLLRISTCSLAVFYVEQVALNRYVPPQQAASNINGREMVDCQYCF